MKKVIALIPARSGSKGVPNKNMRLLGEHKLLDWSIKAALKVPLIERVIVSTDSLEYAEHSKITGAEAPFLRPKNISQDQSTDYEFILHALDWLKANSTEPEFIVHLRPTTPIRDPLIINEAIANFINSKDRTSLRSVHEMSESAYKTFEINEDGNLKRLAVNSTELDSANIGRQSFPKTFIANGYVDVLSTKFIRDNNLLHGNRVYPFITIPTGEVDSENDFLQLEYEISYKKNLLLKLFG